MARRVDAGDQVEDGRLAGAVRPDQRDERAGARREVEPRDRRQPAEAQRAARRISSRLTSRLRESVEIGQSSRCPSSPCGRSEHDRDQEQRVEHHAVLARSRAAARAAAVSMAAGEDRAGERADAAEHHDRDDLERAQEAEAVGVDVALAVREQPARHAGEEARRPGRRRSCTRVVSMPIDSAAISSSRMARNASPPPRVDEPRDRGDRDERRRRSTTPGSRSAGRRRNAAEASEKPRAPPTASMFRISDADDLAEAERRDRQVVAAQAQRRDADQQPASAATSPPKRSASGKYASRASGAAAPGDRAERAGARRTRDERAPTYAPIAMKPACPIENCPVKPLIRLRRPRAITSMPMATRIVQVVRVERAAAAATSSATRNASAAPTPSSRGARCDASDLLGLRRAEQARRAARAGSAIRITNAIASR